MLPAALMVTKVSMTATAVPVPLAPEKHWTTISEVAPTMSGNCCAARSNVALNVPLNGAVTALLVGAREACVPVPGSTIRTFAEAFLPAGQGMVVWR